MLKKKSANGNDGGKALSGTSVSPPSEKIESIGNLNSSLSKVEVPTGTQLSFSVENQIAPKNITQNISNLNANLLVDKNLVVESRIISNRDSQSASLGYSRKRDRKRDDQLPIEDISTALMSENSPKKKRRTSPLYSVASVPNESKGQSDLENVPLNPLSTGNLTEPVLNSMSSMPSISSMPSLHIVGMSNLSKNSSAIDLEDPFISK